VGGEGAHSQNVRLDLCIQWVRPTSWGHISKMQEWTKQATTSSYRHPILGMASLWGFTLHWMISSVVDHCMIQVRVNQGLGCNADITNHWLLHLQNNCTKSAPQVSVTFLKPIGRASVFLSQKQWQDSIMILASTLALVTPDVK
jgi:hypothetical protein